MLGSGRGLKATQEHTTIIALIAVYGGGLLACLITGGANRALSVEHDCYLSSMLVQSTVYIIDEVCI